MKSQKFKDKNNQEWLWFDLKNPSQEQLTELKSKFHLNFASFEKCIQPGQLPKFESNNVNHLIFIRAFDDCAVQDADNLRQITRKVSLFFGPNFLISIHRQDVSFLDAIWNSHERDSRSHDPIQLALEIISGGVATYLDLLEDSEVKIEQFETSVIDASAKDSQWREIFKVSCRLSVAKRMLWHSLDALQKLHARVHFDDPSFHNTTEHIRSLQFLPMNF